MAEYTCKIKKFFSFCGERLYYNKNKVILNKLLGETVPVKKITESHIEKINQYKQKRKTN